MNESSAQTPRSIPLGGLGAGVVEICGDGRFRNLTINNNRNVENRIPEAPHSFLGVAVSSGKQRYVRRLQTPMAGRETPHLLPAGGLQFRGHYPQVDCRVVDPGAPVEILWSAFAPVIPYDYDASSLPVIFFGIQVANTSEGPVDVSAVFNWQNTCGQSAINHPEHLPPIGREAVVTDADWDRMTNRRGGDNERRLMSNSGQVETTARRTFAAGEVPPNALVFGGLNDIDANEDGQYCVVTPWTDDYRTSLAVWDPEEPASAGAFWKALASGGQFDLANPSVEPRAGAVCNQFTLAPGESKTVEFVVSWYCPRYAVAGPDEGNYYTNNHADAKSAARIAVDNRKYFFAAVAAWQKRFNTSDIPPAVVKRLFTSCEVLSTNSIHTRAGDFGLLASMHDPRVNYLRDRWYWSMGLLLFFPRLELEILDRLSEGVLDPETRELRVSEGIESISGGEFVAPGAIQVEACAHLVALAYRNFVFGGNVSSVARIAPRLQSLMAALLAQDKDIDGFPDIAGEAPGLDGPFASGFNVITAGLWIVALRVYERIARRQKYAEADLYMRAYDRAFRSFDKYFWDRENGYYTLYPKPEHGLAPASDLSSVCHIGQLIPIWIAGVLDMPETFSRSRVTRLLETIEKHHVHDDRIQMLSLPGAGDTGGAPGLSIVRESRETNIYTLIPYLWLTLEKAPDTPIFDRFAQLTADRPVRAGSEPPAGDMAENRHIGHLALWYLVAASPAAQLNLSERRLDLRPDLMKAGEKKTITLYTPNGFGAVTIEVAEGASFHCGVNFSMDIPQEIAAIELTLPGGIEAVQCVLEVDEGPVRTKTAVQSAGETQTVVTVTPDSKLSTPLFTLRVEETGPDEESAASIKLWIPQWFRK